MCIFVLKFNKKKETFYLQKPEYFFIKKPVCFAVLLQPTKNCLLIYYNKEKSLYVNKIRIQKHISQWIKSYSNVLFIFMKVIKLRNLNWYESQQMLISEYKTVSQ